MALRLVKTLGVLATVLTVAAVSFSIFLQDASNEVQELLNIPATGIETVAALFVPLVFGYFFYYYVSNL